MWCEVKEWADICQTYERMSSGILFRLTLYTICCLLYVGWLIF